MKLSAFIALLAILVAVTVTVTVAIPLTDSEIARGDVVQNDALQQADSFDDDDDMIALENQESTTCSGCDAGTYFAGGRCQPCHKGRYNSGCISRGPMCTLCPTGTSTLSTGSRSLADCTCGSNMFFDDKSLLPNKCTKCPVGHEFLIKGY
jgi:hypothetical protein